MKITEKFLTAIDSFALDGGVLIALSGGADSMCLTNLFLHARENGSFPYAIAAAHLNHSLRGEEADRDENFCREFCEKNKIRFFAKKLDIKEMAKESGLSTEEEARNARYAFFDEVLSEEHGISYIATAHNKNDLAETMLLNLVRGSGIDGLRSIPRRRDNIIRPLLDADRGEITRYLEENDIPYVTDSSNLTDEYSRNKVRHNILPHFSDISEGYLDCICRASSLLAKDADFLNGEAKKAYDECVENNVLYTKKAQKLHPSLLSRVIKLLYNDSGFSSLSEVHIDALREQISQGKENFSLSLHGCTAVCERGQLQFLKSIDTTDFCVNIELEKEIRLPSGITVLLTKEKCDGAIPLRAEAFGESTVVRSRYDGDTIKMFGKTHKIKRMISDKKLNSYEKSRLFFITSDEEIIYSNLPAVSDNAFTKGGENCVYLLIKESL